MRIAIDVMGGDNAPDAILTGSLDAVDLLSDEDCIVLVGDQAIIQTAIAGRGYSDDKRLEVLGTTQVIEMGESPVTALRNKPDASMVKMAKLGGKRAGDKRCDVVFSAGNTGACVAGAQMAMRRLPGVHRPGIAVPLPTFHGPVTICDVGANPEPRASHLYQYGKMAAIYANRVIGVENPRIATLSIGGEESKGNSLVKETAKLFRNDRNVTYVGNIEGRGLFQGFADVVVAEGFTGNVVIKLAEGLSSGLFQTITHEVVEIDPELALRFEPVVKSIYAKHDYNEYGGAPLLGANGICLIGHGSSKALTVTNAIKNALKYVKYKVNEGIIEALEESAALSEGAV